MTIPSWLPSMGLAAAASYLLQITLLLGVGLLLPAVLRPGDARARLRYWQSLLAAVVVVPPAAALTLGLLTVSFGGGATSGQGAAWVEEIVVGGDLALPVASPMVTAVLAWALPVLAVGVLARLLWLAVGLRLLVLFRRQSVALDPLPAALEGLEAEVGCRAQFRLCRRVPGPVTFGWRRPVVLVPPTFLDLDGEAQRTIACHELLHVRRRDWLAVLCEQGLSALLWFHPAVWLLLDRLEVSREQVVDGEVVRLTGRRRAYLEALWSFARSAPHPARKLAQVPALPFFHRGHLLQRVTHLTKELPLSQNQRSRAPLALASIAVLCLTALVGALVFPLSATPAPSAAQDEKILKVEGDVQPPVKLAGSAPVYPPAAKEEKITGIVIAQAVIGLDGRITDVQFLQSLGADFDDSVRTALGDWVFQPATLGGQPVEVFYNLTINFTLE